MSSRSYLPSNAFIVVAILLVSVASIGVLFLLYTDENERDGTSTVLSGIEPPRYAAQVVEMDTDSDGLADWEEALWDTDPRQSDTDRDGTLDGEEVSGGRNPLVAGPDDSLTKKVALSGQDAADAVELTVTDAMGRDLFAEYLQLKQTGTLDVGTQEQLIRDVVARAQKKLSPPVYTLDDIRLSHEGSEEDVVLYKRMLEDALRPVEALEGYELILLAKMMDGNNKEAASEYTQHLLVYHDFVAALKMMWVPPTFAAAHLNLLNSVSFLVFELEAMQDPYSDPLRAATAAGSYLETETAMRRAFTELASLFAAATSS